MKKQRILVLLTVVALMMVMLAMAVGPAFATQPVEPNPSGGSGSFNSNNCVAYNSALVIHNGTDVRNQDRGEGIKEQQALCNAHKKP
jgi:hypothetical protein